MDMTIVESKIQSLHCPATLNIDFREAANPNSYSVTLKMDPKNIVLRIDLFASADIKAFFRLINNDNKVSYKGPYHLSKGRQQLRECFSNVKEVTLTIDNGLNPDLAGVLIIENINV